MKQVTSFFLMAFLIMVAACTGSKEKNERIRVAVFSGNGASSVCVTETMEALKIDGGIAPRVVTARDIAAGVLGELDVIIFPGGSGSKEANNLGTVGMEKVRDFVMKEGGGIVGICAGAYLLSDTPDYPCLHMSGLAAIDRVHDARGGALAAMTLEKGAADIFPGLQGYDSLFVQYNEGPVLVPAGDDIPYTVLAVMQTDVHAKSGAPANMTPGKPYFITALPGKGRAFLSVGHPESTPGMRWIVPRMARWAAGREMVSYPSTVVRPGRDHHSIVFDVSYRKKEKKLFWQLFDEDAQKRIEALEQLHEMRSRQAVRWTMGLLRDKEPEVRVVAAALLSEAEYTAALPDMRQAVEDEPDISARKKMSASLKKLEEITGNGRK